MWKFKASKYKNATPKTPKKEQWISDLNVGSLRPSCGNHIKASSAYMVFNVDSAGGSNLAVLPLESHGRQILTEVTKIQAHSDFVTDFDFAPWDDYLLATGSSDCTVRIWDLPKDELSDNISNARTTLSESKRVENVVWNPVAEGILVLSANQTVKVYDVSAEQEKFTLPEHGDHVQSISWKGDGSLLISSCKDKKIRVMDPRTASVVQEAVGHENIKDSRALWLGNTDKALTTGFDTMRQREVAVRDVRNLREPLKVTQLDSSTGALMPLYDADTGMLFLAGKGDTTVRYLEVTERDPYLSENAVDAVEQIRGLAMVPKRAMDVMKCEATRLLVLAQHAVIPIPYCVPRKSYMDFHADLFPDTFSGEAAMTTEEWLEGKNKPHKVIDLNPAKKGEASFFPGEKTVSAPVGTASPKPVAKVQPTIHAPAEDGDNSGNNSQNGSGTKIGGSSFGVQLRKTQRTDRPTVEALKAPTMGGRRGNALSVVGRMTKLRLMKGKTAHKSEFIENLKKISQNTPLESDGFHCNRKFCVVPQGGPGGMLAVLKLSSPGRLPDTALPSVQNGSTATDFVLDPMDDNRLVAACDDAKIRVWNLPEDGLTQTVTEPAMCLQGHMEKVYFVKFHPLAKDVLASASFDLTCKIWDLQTGEAKITLEGHTEAIQCLAWSSDGQRCATACKDGKIRVYDPRKSTSPIMEGPGTEGSRGSRLVWACNDKYLVMSGFDRMSQRKLSLYSADDISKGTITSMQVDSSPSILIPHYDEDTSTLFFTGKGDTTVFTYEVAEDEPHFFQLDPFKGQGVHTGLSFLPKCVCDVKQVEFAKALRLTKHAIEPVSFTMPRRKMEYFQDDIFPDTKVLWEATLSSSEWFSGTNKPAKTVSLQPSDMQKLSEAPVEAPKAKKYESFHDYEKRKTDNEKKEELLSAMTKKLGMRTGPLVQDLSEGVEDEEWDD